MFSACAPGPSSQGLEERLCREKLVLKQVIRTACITLHSLRSMSQALTHVAVVDLINRSFQTLTPHLQNELQLHRIKKVVDRLGPPGVYDPFLFAPFSQSLHSNIWQNGLVIGLVNQSAGLDPRNTQCNLVRERKC